MTVEEYEALVQQAEATGKVIVKVNGQFQLADPPPVETRTIRTFSKFAIWVATRGLTATIGGAEVNVWAAFEQFLRDAELWTGYHQLIDLVEDNPLFAQFYPQAVAQFGAELVDQVLAAATTETRTIIVNQE